jgi:hypothetical protein
MKKAQFIIVIIIAAYFLTNLYIYFDLIQLSK